MKKFSLKLLLYLFPLPLYIGVIFLVDPFDFYGISKLISQDTKTEISEKINPSLWKLIEFDHCNAQRIILGDSRAAKIRPDHVKAITGEDYYNFAYPGGTLPDMIETFWYANSKVNLKEVYMGINFNLYNDFEKNNNVIQGENIKKNFLSYSFSKIVFLCAVKDIYKQFIQKDMFIGKPDMNKEEFWKYHVNIMGKRFYQKYAYPEKYHAELIKISEYCRKNNIKLVFFVPPNHVDWQHRTVDFHLEEENDKFIQDIFVLGKMYNLDVVNKFTQNKNNFLDPVHPVNDSLVVETIWGSIKHQVNSN